MSDHPHVNANYRYIAVYNEINARIAQRQQALTLYVTLTLGLLAALVGLRAGDAQGRLPIEWLALGFPVASACLVFLNYKAERAITHLRGFLATLERLNNQHLQIPGYNSDSRWAASANNARQFHDIASATLVAAGNGIALGAIYRIYPDAHSLTLWSIAIAALAAVVALLLISRLSFKPPSE